MPRNQPIKVEVLLAAVVLVVVAAPLLVIAAVVAARAWQPLSSLDRALLVGCVTALVAIAAVEDRVRMRDPVLRTLLMQPPMAIGVYAFTHDPIESVVYLASSLLILGLVRLCGSRA